MRSVAHKLDESRGRIYSRRCDATFGDARCGKNANNPDYTADGAVGAIADTVRISADGISAFPAGFFRYG
ncbi:MAG: beta-tubulin [Rhizobium sp.]|nr:beta-tubulin [Rhizobium sp.]